MFFDVLSTLCQEHNISAYKACTDVGLNRAAVGKWKKGSIPNGATLSKLADYFGVTTDYLLTGEEKEKAADPKAGGDDESLEDIIPGYDSLTEENKDLVQDYVAVLLAAQQKQ